MAIRIVPFCFRDYVISDTKLDLSNNNIVDQHIPSLCHFLKQNPWITQLDLQKNQLTEKAAQLLSTITTITDLNISHNRLGPAGATYIATMENLESLDISNNNILAAGTLAVAKLPKLSMLRIHTTKEAQPTEIKFGESLAHFSLFTNKQLSDTASDLAQTSPIKMRKA